MLHESILIKKAETNSKKTPMNNKFEFSRTVLPELGKKEPTMRKIEEEESLDKKIRELRKRHREEKERERRQQSQTKRKSGESAENSKRKRTDTIY